MVRGVNSFGLKGGLLCLALSIPLACGEDDDKPASGVGASGGAAGGGSGSMADGGDGAARAEGGSPAGGRGSQDGGASGADPGNDAGTGPVGGSGGDGGSLGDAGNGGSLGIAGDAGNAGSGGSGGDVPTCTEQELFAALPAHFVAAVGSTTCVPGHDYSSAQADATYCDNLPCSCMADLDWQAGVAGNDFVATADVTDSIPVDYDVLGTSGSCTASFSATLEYTATVASSNDGGEFHTVTSDGAWSLTGVTLSGCAILGSARDNLETQIADDILATFQSLDDEAIVASNTCP